jgi:uncharacterized protein (TIGR00255 family)
MRSMTGYGRGEAADRAAKFTVEINSVNRRQSEIAINLPRDLTALEPRIRAAINERIARGRINVLVNVQSANGSARMSLDAELARAYHEAMRALQKELGAPGEITIATILQAPGVLKAPEQPLEAEEAWSSVQEALDSALAELIAMREREGKHLARDLIGRLKAMRSRVKEIRALHPQVALRYRAALLERLTSAGLPLASDDERIVKEIAIFADRIDISEELTRLDSHLSQFAHQLRSTEPIGRTLEFLSQEIGRELNTLGAKANDAALSQHVVACKAELEKIREQIQNLE